LHFSLCSSWPQRGHHRQYSTTGSGAGSAGGSGFGSFSATVLGSGDLLGIVAIAYFSTHFTVLVGTNEPPHLHIMPTLS